MPKVFFSRWLNIPNQIISLSVFLLPMLFILPVKAEIITVNGKVTTGDAAVQYVLVTFEDALDTIQRYTTVTDSLGNYQLELSTTAMKMTNCFQTGFYLEEKGKEIWMTEHLDTDVSWDAVLGTGKEIHDCMNAGMSAYVWWYIVRFYGPIYDGEMGTQKGAVSKRGYVMSQYARFIRPGFHRVKCHATPQRYVYVSAYKSETGNLVIVAINQNSSPLEQIFTLSDDNITALMPYTTSQSRNCEPADEIAISNGRCMVVLAPSSITTFVSK